MRKLNSSKLVALLTGTAVIFLILVTSVSAQAKLTERSKLAINGIGQIKATPHPYVSRPPENGKYLTFVPKDAADKNYRIIFETSKNRVDRFRSGKLPEVEYIEGCS